MDTTRSSYLKFFTMPLLFHLILLGSTGIISSSAFNPVALSRSSCERRLLISTAETLLQGDSADELPLNPLHDDYWWQSVYSDEDRRFKVKAVMSTDEFTWSQFMESQNKLVDGNILNVFNDDTWWSEVYQQQQKHEQQDEITTAAQEVQQTVVQNRPSVRLTRVFSRLFSPFRSLSRTLKKMGFFDKKKHETNSILLNPINDEAWWSQALGHENLPASNCKVKAISTSMTWEQFLAAQEKIRNKGQLNAINDHAWWAEVFNNSSDHAPSKVRFVYPKLRREGESNDGLREVVLI